jgi:hypothetical protein
MTPLHETELIYLRFVAMYTNTVNLLESNNGAGGENGHIHTPRDAWST